MKKLIPLLIFLIILSACQPALDIAVEPTLIVAETVSPASLAPPAGKADVQDSPIYGKGTISQILWSSDGKFIVAGGSDGIRFYTSDTLEEIRYIPTDYLVTSIALSPDGKHLASGTADQAFSRRSYWRRFSPWGSENNFVQLWDVEAGDLLATLKAGGSYVTTVVFSPDGTLLVSGSMYPEDNAVRVWMVDSVLGGDLELWQIHKEHTRGIFGIDFSPDGKRLLSGSGDNSARLWDIYGGKMESILMYRSAAKVKVFAVDYSPVIGENGEELVALAGADFFHNTPTPLLEIWDASTGELVFEIDGHDSSLDSVAFSLDGEILASGGSYPDNKIHLWNVETGQHLRSLPGHLSGVRSLAFSPDGRTLASSGWDAMLHLWDLQTGEIKISNDEHSSFVHSEVLSPNGQILATGGDAGLIRLWDRESGERIALFNTESSRVTSMVFNADGSMLIAGTDEPNFNIQLWDMSTGERINILNAHQSFVQVMALSADDRYLASGGALGDNTVHIWDLENDGVLLYSFDGHTRSVKSLAFSDDGAFLATGDGKGFIRLVDMNTGEVTHAIEAHDCAVVLLSFESENGNLISIDCDGTSISWDVESGELID